VELLDRGADPNVLVGGFNALHRAAMWGRLEIVTMLLGRGAVLESRSYDGTSALLIASLLDHELERGVGGDHDFALLHEIDETRVLDLLDLGEIVSAEKKRAADESEGDGEENEATPVELRVLTASLALAVIVGWLRVFV
jgi:ankyrin repeat protein